MELKTAAPDFEPSQEEGESLLDWALGRLPLRPSRAPRNWKLCRLSSVATLESGHTPSRRQRAYWDGEIPWLSLHDSNELDVPEIFTTAQTVSQLGLANSSARLLPKGTVVLSRTATVGKSTVLGQPMATSQDFANYICGPQLHNRYLMHVFRYMEPEWKRLMAGSTHNTVYMGIFERLDILVPPIGEQESIASALDGVDALISSLDRLLAKKRRIKQGVMRQLLSRSWRLPGFSQPWAPRALGELGFSYGGLTGKTKADFGDGAGRFITFMNVMSNVIIDCDALGRVRVSPSEPQSRVMKGDLFFNGSSETPQDVGMCAVLLADVENVFLNSFCFGFRLHDDRDADGLFLAYYFRSSEGRELLRFLAQGATRYNLSKTALLKVEFPLPPLEEQIAIAGVLSDIDAEIEALRTRRAKTFQLRQGMMETLLPGRVRLPVTDGIAA